MTDLEIKVLNMIPHGMENPVQIRTIQEQTGQSERDVKDMIDTLVKVYEYPIVGLRRRPYGYYIATTKDELDIGLAPYRKQIRTEQERLGKLLELRERLEV